MEERHLTLELLDTKKLININDLKGITSPIFFIRDDIPTADGLLSNEIFGITKDDRSNIFAFIDLNATFMHPLCYKIWCRMDSRIRDIAHGTKKFIINSKGELEESEDGDNGISFLKKNIDKIQIKPTGSTKRDKNIQFLSENKEVMFIKQWIIIPAFFRDINTDRGYIGVGDINKLYNSLIIATKSLKDTADFGLSMTNATNGRIQEILLQIYNWFTDEPNLSKKKGIIRRANLSKTTDYASRLVLSASDLRVETVGDLMVDMDHSAVPLASICTNFFPFMLFYIRRFFETEFGGDTGYAYIEKATGKIKQLKIKDTLSEFSDARIKKELDRFMRGYSNRFIPIEVPNEEGKLIYMSFKGRIYQGKFVDNEDQTDEEVIGKSVLSNRRLTWCDIFYMAAVEVTKDKTILITRYPIDSSQNQFPTKVIVSSTKETEPILYDNVYYKYYPKIREEDIGSNTSNKFIDTMRISNLYLPAVGGDYDGDIVSDKGIFTTEANEELENFMNSKAHYISLNGINMRTSNNEAIQSLYSLTKILPDTKITSPIF
ncbi:MAG: hypothetical protein M0P49_02410 [Bacilli bacterium]|nr:hypothetical protein [Bacilli bacterium]